MFDSGASRYPDSAGRNSTLRPDFAWRFHRRVGRLGPGEYVLGAAEVV